VVYYVSILSKILISLSFTSSLITVLLVVHMLRERRT
jgi:hypothetical protein